MESGSRTAAITSSAVFAEELTASFVVASGNSEESAVSFSGESESFSTAGAG